MITNKTDYEIIYTKECQKEINEIYSYIYQKLYSPNSAKKLMNQIEKRILFLKIMPKLYPKISNKTKLKNEYRKMVIKNFIILYTISKNKIYIVHMYYNKKNYLNYL